MVIDPQGEQRSKTQEDGRPPAQSRRLHLARLRLPSNATSAHVSAPSATKATTKITQPSV